jgi:Domain of unknown function (DUF4917)
MRSSGIASCGTPKTHKPAVIRCVGDGAGAAEVPVTAVPPVAPSEATALGSIAMPDYFPGLDNSDFANWGYVLQYDPRWGGTFLGNGASRAVSDAFGYASLYERARSTDIADPLTEDDVALFDAFGNANFELILGSPTNAARVASALGGGTDELRSGTSTSSAPY